MKNLSRTHKLLLFLAAGLFSLFFIFLISEWNAPTPEIALRKCYGASLRAVKDYENRSTEPDSLAIS